MDHASCVVRTRDLSGDRSMFIDKTRSERDASCFLHEASDLRAFKQPQEDLTRRQMNGQLSPRWQSLAAIVSVWKGGSIFRPDFCPDLRVRSSPSFWDRHGASSALPTADRDHAPARRLGLMRSDAVSNCQRTSRSFADSVAHRSAASVLTRCSLQRYCNNCIADWLHHARCYCTAYLQTATQVKK